MKNSKKSENPKFKIQWINLYSKLKIQNLQFKIKKLHAPRHAVTLSSEICNQWRLFSAFLTQYICSWWESAVPSLKDLQPFISNHNFWHVSKSTLMERTCPRKKPWWWLWRSKAYERHRGMDMRNWENSSYLFVLSWPMYYTYVLVYQTGQKRYTRGSSICGKSPLSGALNTSRFGFLRDQCPIFPSPDQRRGNKWIK